MITQEDFKSIDDWFKTIRITTITVIIEYEEPYRLCNMHLRTWRAYNSTEDSQRA